MSVDGWTATLRSETPTDREPAGLSGHLNHPEVVTLFLTLMILVGTCCPELHLPVTQNRSVPSSSGKGTDPECLKVAITLPCPSHHCRLRGGGLDAHVAPAELHVG